MRALPSERPSLTEISNTAAALHREHLGRGPGAVRSHLTDELVVCVLTDVFTLPERALIEAGEGERVRSSRAILRSAVDEVYKARMAQVVGRPVSAYVSTVGIEASVVVDVFILGPEKRESGAA